MVAGADLEPPARGEGLGQPAEPAGERGEHRPGRRAGPTSVTARAAATSDPPASRRAASFPIVARRDNASARPAYTPPSNGSTSRSATSSPSRPRTSAPTDTSSVSGAIGGRAGSAATASSPAAVSTPDARSGLERGRDTEHRPGRKGMVAPGGPHPGRRRRRRDALVGQAEGRDEVGALGAGGQQRLGSDVDREPRDLRDLQLAADPRRGLEHGHVVPGRRGEPGRRQPGDPAADDGQPGRHPSECTSSTIRVSTSGSVSGGTPWPRLKMCPAAPRPSATTRRTAASTTGQSAPQQRRVEVALDDGARPQPAGRLVERDAPVDADDVGAGRAHRPRAVRRCPTPKWMRGTRAGERFEHRPAVRQHELGVVGERQRAGPGVEELDRGRAGGDLHPQELARDHGQPAEQGVPEIGSAVHERLGLRMVARRAALDQVAGQGERRPGEADQRRRRRARRRGPATAALM